MSLTGRENQSLLRGLVYIIVTVLSVLALVYLDTGNKPHSTIQLKSEIRKLGGLTSSEKQNECGTLHDDVTLMIGDFNDTLHPIHKVYESNQLYTKLAPLLSNLRNPVVGYFEDKQTVNLFLNARNKKQQLKYMTRTYQINYSDTWTYTLLPYFKEITTKKKSTDSLEAEHMCYQHLKYELLQKTLRENPFCTKYFAWVDLVLLTDLTTTMEVTAIQDFGLHIPSDLEMDRVAFQQLKKLSNVSIEDIFQQDKTWLCGEVFFGKREPMIEFLEDYMQELLKLLARGLAGSDNNVLCALNISGEENFHFKLQVYYPVVENQNTCLDLLLLLKQSGDELEHGS